MTVPTISTETYSPKYFTSTGFGTKELLITLGENNFKCIDVFLIDIQANATATNTISFSTDGISFLYPLILDMTDAGQKSGFVKIIDRIIPSRFQSMVSMVSKKSTSFASGSQGFMSSQDMTFTGGIKYIKLTTSAATYTNGVFRALGWN